MFTYSTPHRLGAAVVACALLLGCSSDNDTGDDVDPIPGSTPSSIVDGGATGVPEDGTSDGLDLDDGNVPGSANDDDLDRYTEDG